MARAALRSAETKRLASRMPSTYISTASVPGSATRKSSTSPKSTSAAAPRDTTLLKPTPEGFAQSRIAVQIAPDCDTSASLPGSAGTGENVAFSPASVRISPRQFGPSRRRPCRRAAASASACNARPGAPLSPKPLVSTTAARTPALPASSRIPATARAGVASTASSGGCGSLPSRA